MAKAPRRTVQDELDEAGAQIAATTSVAEIWTFLWTWPRKLSEAWSLVCRHAPVLDDSLVLAMLSAHVSTSPLVEARGLTIELRGRMLAWCVTRLTKVSEKADMDYAAFLAGHLIGARDQLPDAWETDIPRLLAALPPIGHGQWRERDIHVASLVAHCPLTPAQFEQLVGAVCAPGTPQPVLRAATAQRAWTTVHWSRVLRVGGPLGSFAAAHITGVRALRTQPVLREAVQAYVANGQLGVSHLTGLLADRIPEEFVPLLQRLVKKEWPHATGTLQALQDAKAWLQEETQRPLWPALFAGDWPPNVRVALQTILALPVTSAGVAPSSRRSGRTV